MAELFFLGSMLGSLTVESVGGIVADVPHHLFDIVFDLKELLRSLGGSRVIAEEMKEIWDLRSADAGTNFVHLAQNVKHLFEGSMLNAFVIALALFKFGWTFLGMVVENALLTFWHVLVRVLLHQQMSGTFTIDDSHGLLMADVTEILGSRGALLIMSIIR